MRDSGGVFLASSYVGPGANDAFAEGVVEGLPTLVVSFVAPATGTYFADIHSLGGDFGPERSYMVEVR